MSKHQDRGVHNVGPFAYMGEGGELYRAGYRENGYAIVHRAEYGLSARGVELGEVFE